MEKDNNITQYEVMLAKGVFKDLIGMWAAFARGHLLEIAPDLNKLMTLISANPSQQGILRTNVFVQEIGVEDKVIDIPTLFEVVS